MTINLSQHAKIRMQQRGIPERALSLLLEYGNSEFDHRGTRVIYFSRARKKMLEAELQKSELKRVESALNAYMVVSAKDEVVTVGHRTRRINRC